MTGGEAHGVTGDEVRATPRAPEGRREEERGLLKDKLTICAVLNAVLGLSYNTYPNDLSDPVGRT